MPKNKLLLCSLLVSLLLTFTEMHAENALFEPIRMEQQQTVPKNWFQKTWWNFRLGLTKTFTRKECINVRAYDKSEGNRYKQKYCGKAVQG